jgi:hypothetical protein
MSPMPINYCLPFVSLSCLCSHGRFSFLVGIAPSRLQEDRLKDGEDQRKQERRSAHARGASRLAVRRVDHRKVLDEKQQKQARHFL